MVENVSSASAAPWHTDRQTDRQTHTTTTVTRSAHAQRRVNEIICFFLLPQVTLVLRHSESVDLVIIADRGVTDAGRRTAALSALWLGESRRDSPRVSTACRRKSRALWSRVVAAQAFPTIAATLLDCKLQCLAQLTGFCYHIIMVEATIIIITYHYISSRKKQNINSTQINN